MDGLLQPSRKNRPAPGAGLYGRLSRLNPFWFMAFYAAVLALFAFAFYGQPAHSFYAPYARFEPGAYADGMRVGDDITRALGRPRRYPYSEMGSSWIIDPLSIQVGEIVQSAPEQLEFDISFLAYESPAQGASHAQSFEKFRVIVTRRAALVMLSKRDEHYVHPVEVAGRGSVSTSPSLAELLRLPASVVATPALGPAIDLDRDGESDLNAFLVGLSGEPTTISGHLGRMFYLSATTITTTGFGDIVPLSGFARFLCGAEAVLGWLIAGLFLNAAAWRAAGQNDPPPSG